MRIFEKKSCHAPVTGFFLSVGSPITPSASPAGEDEFIVGIGPALFHGFELFGQ